MMMMMMMILGVERNRKANLLVISETWWIIYSGIILLLFNWSFLAEIAHWIDFVCFCVSAGFMSECLVLSEINVQKKESQYQHYQNFSPTSNHWIQKCECLLHEFEYQIMLSVSVFVSWNSSRKWNHYLNGCTVILTVSAIITRHY